VQALQKECERLSTESDDIWRRYMGGEHSAQQRVLEMPKNPAQQRMDLSRARIEGLQRDNEQLIQRIAELEAAGASAPGTEFGSQVGQQSLQTILELREALKMKEKVLDRVRSASVYVARSADMRLTASVAQVFKAKGTEYRETVEALFGFKVKWEQDGRVKLTSSFARSAKGTTLTFRSDRDDMGAMKIHGEAMQGMANIENLRTYWLDGAKSVPCFLAALNIE